MGKGHIEYKLVKKILNGNPEDFRLIINKYRKLVYHIVFRLVDNQTDREELGQEIFIKIYRSLPSFRFKSNLATWITKIAYHTSLNYLRKKKIPLYDNSLKNITKNDRTGSGDEPSIQKAVSDTALQDETFMKKEANHFLHQEIERLPVQYKQIITWYHLDSLSYQEIGEIMDMPIGTVKSYMFRARKLLKNRLLAKYKPEELCP